jgi:hypothetical protein
VEPRRYNERGSCNVSRVVSCNGSTDLKTRPMVRVKVELVNYKRKRFKR